jgi:hypothetical protein
VILFADLVFFSYTDIKYGLLLSKGPLLRMAHVSFRRINSTSQNPLMNINSDQNYFGFILFFFIFSKYIICRNTSLVNVISIKPVFLISKASGEQVSRFFNCTFTNIRREEGNGGVFEIDSYDSSLFISRSWFTSCSVGKGICYTNESGYGGVIYVKYKYSSYRLSLSVEDDVVFNGCEATCNGSVVFINSSHILSNVQVKTGANPSMVVYNQSGKFQTLINDMYYFDITGTNKPCGTYVNPCSELSSGKSSINSHLNQTYLIIKEFYLGESNTLSNVLLTRASNSSLLSDFRPDVGLNPVSSTALIDSFLDCYEVVSIGYLRIFVPDSLRCHSILRV